MSNQQQEGDTNHTRSTLRILCLHDRDSNALELHQNLEALDEQLYAKHGVELVFINSPLVRVEQEQDGPPRRIWWQSEDGQYNGLDASLLHLRQTWNSMPFSGILAVGEGAALASMLPVIGVPGLKFGVFVRGQALLEEGCGLLSDWNCLHVMNANNDSSQRLVRQVGGKVHVCRKKILAGKDFNAIGKFIVEQKKRLRRESYVLALQSELNTVEQEAARVVAQHVSQNPPRALMAIISPHSVGGWTGKKRQEPAGGAPCPSSFLLRKDKRPAEAGAGRQHPISQAAKEEEGEGA